MKRVVTVVSGVFALGLVAATAPVGALATANGCRGDSLKPKLHTEALRREGTIANLQSDLEPRSDPFGLNSGQLAALRSASSGIEALDAKIVSTCYSSALAFRADAKQLFDGYRVYWLRVPQTHVIGAADRLERASAKLQDAATKLAPLVGANATAAADLKTMNDDIDKAVGLLGNPPHAGPSISAVAALVPAADMSAGDAALGQAHTDLVTIRQALLDARTAGKKVIADVRGP